jgi:hypothetical protein
MAKKKKISKAKPGAVVVRTVTEGPNKGDLVEFRANGPGTMFPGKLVPKRVLKDSGKKNRSKLPKGKKKKAKKK